MSVVVSPPGGSDRKGDSASRASVSCANTDRWSEIAFENATARALSENPFRSEAKSYAYAPTPKPEITTRRDGSSPNRESATLESADSGVTGFSSCAQTGRALATSPPQTSRLL